MINRTIQHPEVEIIEDFSSRSAPLSFSGDYTYVLIFGYSRQGPYQTPTILHNLSQYESVFGYPETEEQEYAYIAAKNIFSQINSKLVFARLSYKNYAFDNKRCLGITIAPSAIQSSFDLGITLSSELQIDNIVSYNSNTVEDVNRINFNEYLSAQTYCTSALTTVFSNDFDFIISLKNEDAWHNSDDRIFVVTTDFFDKLEYSKLIPVEYYDKITSISGVNNYNITKGLSGKAVSLLPILSKEVSHNFGTIRYNNSLSGIYAADNIFKQWLNINVCRLKQDTNDFNKYSLFILESFFGSIHPYELNSYGESVFLGNQISANSEYINFYSKDLNDLSSKFSSFKDDEKTILYEGDNICAKYISYNENECEEIISGSTIAPELWEILHASNLRKQCIIPVDLVVEAGLGTVAQFTKNVSKYDRNSFDIYNSGSQVITENFKVGVWKDVEEVLIYYCQEMYRFCIALLDAPRNLTIYGEKSLISKINHRSYENDIKNKLNFITTFDTSYAAMWFNWFETYSALFKKNQYYPPSIKVLENFIENDYNRYYWTPPAGENYGRVKNLNIERLSYNPSFLEKDDIYLHSINYIAYNSKKEMYTFEGQKTLQKPPALFTRINVRRLFIYFEKRVKPVLQEYIGRINNFATRNELVTRCDSILDDIRLHDGLQDFNVQCNLSNNYPLVISNNELRIAFFIKPTQVIEYVILEFTDKYNSKDSIVIR